MKKKHTIRCTDFDGTSRSVLRITTESGAVLEVAQHDARKAIEYLQAWLDDRLEDDTVRFKDLAAGDRFYIPEEYGKEEYIKACIRGKEYTAINLQNGNRWTAPGEAMDNTIVEVIKK